VHGGGGSEQLARDAFAVRADRQGVQPGFDRVAAGAARDRAGLPVVGIVVGDLVFAGAAAHDAPAGFELVVARAAGACRAGSAVEDDVVAGAADEVVGASRSGHCRGRR
jgi:hypothetical protein